MASIEKRQDENGKAAYRVKIRLKGFPHETATFTRKTDADKWAAATETAMREGRFFKTYEAKRHTLGEAIDRYVKDVLPTKPKSIYAQTIHFKWWKDEIGSKTLADVTPALIVECRDRLSAGITPRGTVRSPATVNRYLAALSVCLSTAANEWNWLEISPMRKVKKQTESRGRVRSLSSDERTRLMTACKGSSNKMLYVAVLLALSTGARQAEIMNLTWDDVDLTRGRAILHETKNGERRALPLAGYALDTLREYAKVRRIDTPLLFPSSQKPSQPIDLRKPWEAALQAAGIDNFHFHDLRHSAASELAMSGATLAEIAEILGHKTLQMVKRYSHLTEGHTAKVVERMNHKIFGAQ